MNFGTFRAAIAQQFANMCKDAAANETILFRTEATGNDMWQMYLDSFPAGTNPMFRERTEHDCNCCKQFVRAVGNVVYIDSNNKIASIWDIDIPSEPAYQAVAKAMNQFVIGKPIDCSFKHYEKTAGTSNNFSFADGTIDQEWSHFFVQIPNMYVVASALMAQKRGEERGTVDVFKRGLEELSVDAIDTVLELIAQNSIYRGEEHKWALQDFRKYLVQYKTLDADVANIQVWAWQGVSTGTARFKNTAIGSLVDDLSKGIELEPAVKQFESKVAPTNYKRTTALVTEKQRKQAQEKVVELGLMSALERRPAQFTDLSINNLLFADRTIASKVTGTVFDEVDTKKKPQNFKHVEEINIEQFIANVLPTAKTVEVMVEHSHLNNFVSLITAVDPTAERLFKWDNPFSWSYVGETTDSIKERVKAAGGNVDGDVCCRLAWFNYDDLDFHMQEPGGNEIYFGSKHSYISGGCLDVDMNAGSGTTREPVENIVYESKHRMKPGKYVLQVHQFSKRETSNGGFVVDIVVEGVKYTFEHTAAVPNRTTVTVATITVDKNHVITVEGALSTGKPKNTTKWGITTNEWTRVNAITLSPNFWEGEKGIGNKHYMFMLDGCTNEDKSRGFYNEFLREELNPHRKVMEIVGAKMQLAGEHQLSGLGFSSTITNSIMCRVSGATTRIVKVTF